MFQLKGRVSAITLNDAEREVINERLIAYQQEKGIVFSSIKELFSVLLSDAITTENKETKEIVKEVIPENLVILTENNEAFEEFQNKLNDFKESKGIQSDTPLFDSCCLALKTAMKTPDNIEIEKEVIKEVEKVLANNQILITLTDEPKRPIEKKLMLLDEVAKRRKHKYGKEESLNELCEKMIFNDGTIFNLSGEFYTGY